MLSYASIHKFLFLSNRDVFLKRPADVHEFAAGKCVFGTFASFLAKSPCRKGIESVIMLSGILGKLVNFTTEQFAFSQ